MIRPNLIIPEEKIKKLKQSDIIKYAERHGWTYGFTATNESLVYNHPTHTKEDGPSLLIVKDEMVDAISRKWENIQVLSEYYQKTYQKIYEEILMYRNYPNIDPGHNIKAYNSWELGGGEAVSISVDQHYNIKHINMSAKQAIRLGHELINAGVSCLELDLDYCNDVIKDMEKRIKKE